MKNFGNMLKQAQQMQSKMEEMQEKLAVAEYTGEAGGGMVTVTLNGKGAMNGIKIDPNLMQPDDHEVLEDLVMAAFNDARTKVSAAMEEQMSDLTGGLPLPPGFKLPF